MEGYGYHCLYQTIALSHSLLFCLHSTMVPNRPTRQHSVQASHLEGVPQGQCHPQRLQPQQCPMKQWPLPSCTASVKYAPPLPICLCVLFPCSSLVSAQAVFILWPVPHSPPGFGCHPVAVPASAPALPPAHPAAHASLPWHRPKSSLNPKESVHRSVVQCSCRERVHVECMNLTPTEPHTAL